jgi:pyruvate/2-oxoglutarate dehydrogenase complex dihydrolipoamide dehydrogenase (E3) component
MAHYDVVVIGSGQGGFPFALQSAGKGEKAALVENRNVGGTCVNYGCTPTKTMVASARAAHVARRGSAYGVQLSFDHVDMETVRKRKRDIVDDFRGGSERYVEETDGVDLIRATASFQDAHTLNLEMNDGSTDSITADTIVINTGTRAAVPPIAGVESVNYLTNETIMELDEVPEHLIVVGGSYIGLEFGQMFARFGSRVTIVHRGPQLAPREDSDVGTEVKSLMEQEGIEVLLNADAKALEEDAGGVKLTADVDGSTREVRGSHILMAAGRTPNSDALKLQNAGIRTSRRGHIEVNERLETGVPGVYAIGDVKGGPAFTHISYADSQILMENIHGEGNATITDRLVPYTMFTDPQLARVGLSEADARKRGKPFMLAKLPMSSVARALETDETHGLMKAVIDSETQRILGFTMLGIQAGEVMGAVQIAMLGGLPYTALRDGTFAHPTLIESLNNLFATAAEA